MRTKPVEKAEDDMGGGAEVSADDEPNAAYLTIHSRSPAWEPQIRKVQPVCALNGTTTILRWGTTTVPVVPGHYRVSIGTQRSHSLYGMAETLVELHPRQQLDQYYASPYGNFPGAIGFTPQEIPGKKQAWILVLTLLGITAGLILTIAFAIVLSTITAGH